MIKKEWLAGFIDGEGYIGIMKSSNKQSRFGYYYYPAIKIAQTERYAKVLYDIKDQFGGYTEKRKPHGQSSPSVMWTIKGIKQLKLFLPHIIDDLIIKKPQANLLMEFIGISTITTRKQSLLAELLPEQDKKREKLYLEIKAHNKSYTLAETE
jgi:hypothetical protein